MYRRITMSNELYHYGVPGMKWGQRKAKLQSAADSYRKAAKTETNVNKANKYLNKASKLEKKSAALDTKQGRIKYNVKKGAAITAGVLAASGALYISNFKGWKMGKKHMMDRVQLVLDIMESDIIKAYK